MRSLPLLLVLSACGATGQATVDYALYGAGTGPVAQAGAYTITLDRAEVAIGPIYFCATEAASTDLCSAAVNELADIVVVDALDPSPQAIGRITGSTGTIRSATYDHGYTWFPTQTAPRAAPQAPGGHSARLAGTISDGTRSFRVTADLDLIPTYQGTRAVQGRRVGPAEITDGGQRLDLALDAAGWWAEVDLEALSAEGLDTVEVLPTSRAYNALLLAMSAQRPARFTWSATP